MITPVIDSSSWTGIPSAVRWSSGPYGELLTERQDMDLVREERRERRRMRLGALRMLWGPPIINAASTGRRTDGVIDYNRERGDDWTLWRGLVATFAIIFDRSHGRKQEILAKRRTGRSYVSSMDMGFWDGRSDGYGYSVLCCSLYPGARVSIYSDGESWF